MKKILAFILTLCIVLSCNVFALGEENEVYSFEPRLTSTQSFSASDWVKSSENRAIFSMLIACDMLLAYSDNEVIDALGTWRSYVGRDGQTLILYATLIERGVLVSYEPSTQEACFSYTEYLNSTQAETVLAEICADGYYENDIDDVFDVAEMLAGLLG